jgi:hypothetical protein
MIKQLFVHYLKEQRRSPAFHKNLAANIAIGTLVGLFMLNVLGLGLFIDRILAETAPDSDPIELFNGFVLYYFGVELMFRLFFSKPKTQPVLPYLHLPVKRSTLAHYSIIRSFFSLFNIFPLLLAVPFALKVIHPVDAMGALKWLFSIFVFSLTVALINHYLKRQSLSRPRGFLLFLGVIVLLIALDTYDVFSLSAASSWFFGKIVFQPFFFLIAPILLSLIYFVNYRTFKKHIYPAEFMGRKSRIPASTPLAFLERFGETGKYVELEYKLLSRNKRARSTLFSAFFLSAVCLLFFLVGDLRAQKFFLIYMGLIATGMVLLSYGQFLWEGHYLDLILSRNVDFYQYYQAKYLLMMGLNACLFVLIIPLVFLGVDLLLMNLALFLYNIGVNAFVVMYLTTYSRKRLDLEESVISPQGKGSSQYLTILPTIFLPMIVIYAPITIFGSEDLAVAAFGVLGAIGLILRKHLLRLVVRQFIRQKYKISAAFRES